MTNEREELDAPTGSVQSYYMRDNHTFRFLRPGHEVEDALAEYDAGYSGGMLCATIGESHYNPVVHARVGLEGREKFRQDAEAFVKALPNTKGHHE